MLKCMITGKEFDDLKSFPAERGQDGKVTNAHEKDQRAHAAEASQWRHVEIAVEGKTVLSGHIAPGVDVANLTLSSSKGGK